MLIFIKNLIVIFLLLVNYTLTGQYLDLLSGKNISNMVGDELHPEWSPDGMSLVFQKNIRDKSNIYIYQFEKDTTLHTSNPDFNFKNPVWHPDGDKIVFDSDLSGYDFLYSFNINTNEVVPLFARKIACRNASFSNSSRQVYFTGMDELTGMWEVYSYDFIYDNLNKITNYNSVVPNLDIDKAGKLVVFSRSNAFSNSQHLEIINWYGEEVYSFNSFSGESASWGPNGLKIFFVSDKDGVKNELYSVWKDGSHLEKVTDCDVDIASPAVSPDGSKIALSVKTEKGWDIIVIPFEDY